MDSHLERQNSEYACCLSGGTHSSESCLGTGMEEGKTRVRLVFEARRPRCIQP